MVGFEKVFQFRYVICLATGSYMLILSCKYLLVEPVSNVFFGPARGKKYLWVVCCL